MHVISYISPLRAAHQIKRFSAFYVVQTYVLMRNLKKQAPQAYRWLIPYPGWVNFSLSCVPSGNALIYIVNPLMIIC